MPRPRLSSWARACLGLCLLAGSVIGAQAFTFAPITQSFAPGGQGASHVFRLTNPTDERVAVQISIVPRSMNVDGTEVQGPESEEFVIFPRQLLMDPGERRSVRVRWTGPDQLEHERAYRIIAAQVPVDMGQEQPLQGGGIRLTYRYEGSIYVVPPGARPEISVASVERTTRDGEWVLLVRVANTGTRHTLLTDASLQLTDEPSGEVRLELGPEQLPGMAGENVLADSVREFVIPAPEGLWEGRVYARIRIDAE